MIDDNVYRAMRLLKVRRGGTGAYEGPYLIESVPSPKKYTLSSENGKSTGTR